MSDDTRAARTDRDGMIVVVQVRGTEKTYRNAERAYVAKNGKIVVINDGEKHTYRHAEIVGCHVGCSVDTDTEQRGDGE